MILILDIGNSNIKSALNIKNEITDFKIHTSISNFITYVQNKKPNDIVICSVVPEKTEKVIQFLKQNFSIDPFIVSVKSKFNLSIKYKTPETLGIDRLCSLEGAIAELSEKEKDLKEFTLITIDFGTATTINIAVPPLQFIGGVIAPGINTMISSLTDKTAQLPKVDISNFKNVIGEDTSSSIASGVLNSATGLIDKMIYYLNNDLGLKNIKAYVTGGNAKIIIPHLRKYFIYDEALVLKGAKSIYELNKN